MVDFSEYVDDISGLEPLKKLERLDLYKTKLQMFGY
jgi:hypothetical protein